jgi:hypothetical protein
MKIITRKEAMQQGLKRYYTGKLCEHGHDSERYTNMTRCVECHKQRDKHARINAAVSSSQLGIMLEAQYNKCALCLTPLLKTRSVVDHCHTTGEVRAVLCLLCNTMLGAARDNPETLRAAAKYLELFKE